MIRCLFRQSCVLVLALSAVMAGCSNATEAAPGGIPGAETSRSAEPTSVALTVVDPPPMTVRDYALPPGCIVEDYTESLAAYSQCTYVEYPGDMIGLLDLKTGEAKTVLSTPVGASEHFNAFSPMLSDDWLVWEEVSPGEGYDMDNATWRLYAAPVLRDPLSIGTPILIDHGDTSIVRRPFYNVWNDEIVWTRLTYAVSNQEAPVIHSEVMALDPATGTTRTITRSDNPWHAVNFSGDCALITEVVDFAAAEYAVAVVGLADGEEIQRVPFSARYGVSHFVERVEGRVFWATFPNKESTVPSLFCAGAGGEITKLRPVSSDSVGVGTWVFCESALQEGRAAADDSYSAIAGIDMDNGTTWFLEKTDEGVWQLPMRSGLHENMLIGSLDLSELVDGTMEGKTIVRTWVVAR